MHDSNTSSSWILCSEYTVKFEGWVVNEGTGSTHNFMHMLCWVLVYPCCILNSRYMYWRIFVILYMGFNCFSSPHKGEASSKTKEMYLVTEVYELTENGKPKESTFHPTTHPKQERRDRCERDRFRHWGASTNSNAICRWLSLILANLLTLLLHSHIVMWILLISAYLLLVYVQYSTLMHLTVRYSFPFTMHAYGTCWRKVLLLNFDKVYVVCGKNLWKNT